MLKINRDDVARINNEKGQIYHKPGSPWENLWLPILRAPKIEEIRVHISSIWFGPARFPPDQEDRRSPMTRVLYFRYTNRFVKGNIVAIRCLLHKLPLSCIDSELLLQHPELTMNRRLTFPWVFCSFFVDLNRRLSSNQSSRISWNLFEHYSCNMTIFYVNNGWVRCWICIFYLKNWCNFFYLWVLQYTTLQPHFFCLHKRYI